MAKSAGDQKLAFIFGRQFHRHPFFVSGRTFAQIHRYIQYRTAAAAHQLCLGSVTLLKMDASQRSFLGGIGLVVLHKVIMQTRFFHISSRPGLHKPAAMIAKYLRFQNIDVQHLSWNDIHNGMLL